MNAHIEIKTITPNEASLMLENRYEMQRKIRPKVVADLEREMRNGTFRLSTDAILLINGTLGNGQHRLTAVVQSGRAQKFLLLKTNEPEIFKIVDCGLKRAIGDSMQLANATNVSAAARWILAIEKGQVGPLSGSANATMTRSEIMDFISANNDELQSFYTLVNSFYKGSKLLPRSAAAAFLWLAYQRGAEVFETAEAMLEKLYSGKNCDGAINDLRNRLISNTGSRAKLPGGYVMGLLIKTFKAVMEGKKSIVLRFIENEKYPEFPSSKG